MLFPNRCSPKSRQPTHDQRPFSSHNEPPWPNHGPIRQPLKEAAVRNTGLVDAVPEEDKTVARSEGWIAVPKATSLDLLAGG
jgi:hypothetical protein